MDEKNMNLLLNMLSKMDKKDLEKGIERATQILNSNIHKEDILNQLKNNRKIREDFYE